MEEVGCSSFRNSAGHRCTLWLIVEVLAVRGEAALPTYLPKLNSLLHRFSWFKSRPTAELAARVSLKIAVQEVNGTSTLLSPDFKPLLEFSARSVYLSYQGIILDLEHVNQLVHERFSISAVQLNYADEEFAVIPSVV